MKEFRTYGPPGVGKTTWLARQVENAAAKFGSNSVFLSSFTRSAAAELVSRNLPVPPHAVGTLHAHCYRAIGSPEIAESHAKEFNDAFPHFAVTPSGTASMDEGTADQPTGERPGDELAAQYQILRNRMTPRSVWPLNVLAFARAWERWKGEAGYMDFTDLIEFALEHTEHAEGNPAVGFIDEAQDLTPLQLALVRKWGQAMEYFILVGDDDQSIYGFTGATPEAFLNPPLPPENKIVLGQSYRIPRVVQAAAVQWIKRVARREEKEYAPRDFEGELLFAPSGNFQQPKPLVEYVKRYIEAGKTIMFLAACSYQLAKLIKTLREEGIPYHNPFRKTRGDWNPLAPRKGTSTVDRLIAYLEPDSPDPGIWSPTQLAQWLEMCTAKGLLKRGAKQMLKGTLPQCPASDAALEEWEAYYKWLDNLFEPGALQGGGWQQEPAWLTAHANATFSPKLDFPMSILGKGGIEALRATPRVVVGTIHSVKGGQADVTVLCPDISLSSYQAATKSQQARDETIRQFYVGMTRCRETLIICKPATQWHVRGLA